MQIEGKRGANRREGENNAERDDGRGVKRKSFGAEEAPSAHRVDSRRAKKRGGRGKSRREEGARDEENEKR